MTAPIKQPALVALRQMNALLNAGEDEEAADDLPAAEAALAAALATADQHHATIQRIFNQAKTARTRTELTEILYDAEDIIHNIQVRRNLVRDLMRRQKDHAATGQCQALGCTALPKNGKTRCHLHLSIRG